MIKKWLGLAIVAASTALATPVLAQPMLPGPTGATRMPDPAPVQGSQAGASKAALPKLIPGPLTSDLAPSGPPDEMSLPDTHNGAFMAEEFADPHEWFCHWGTLALQRQKVGSTVFGFLDSTERDPITTPVDHGELPRSIINVVPFIDADHVKPDLAFGFYGTVGILGRNSSVEVSYFWLPENSVEVNYALPGLLNAVFTNPPAGFEGNNGLFLQGDFAQFRLSTMMGGAEVNTRFYDRAVTGCEPIVGIRYLHLNERFTFTFDDDLFTSSVANPLGLATVTDQARLSSRVYHNFVGPQLGFEYQCNLCKGVALGWQLKSAIGATFSDIDVTLERGDSLFGAAGNRQHTQLSAVSEASLYLDIYFLERFRSRFGYHALSLNRMPEAVDQVNFDLSQPLGRSDNHGNYFFHGLSIELQFLY